MIKTIDTLTEDIYELFDSTKDHIADSTLVQKSSKNIEDIFIKATRERSEPRAKGKLWASDLGKRCLRQHWYNFNEPEHGESLSGNTKFKFLYGNLLEEAVLYFAEEAGHTVTNQQYTVETQVNGWSIRGRIDAIIDGTLIDVKSTSSYGFKRYKDGINASNDSFGYLEQLGFYTHFNDFGIGDVDAGFVWIDKQNGHILYTEVTTPSKLDLEGRAKSIISNMDKAELDVARGYTSKPYGKSGNESLDIACSYCSYKQHCWRDSNGGKGLRGFLYNQGPVWFTKVTREPRCLEMTKD